MKLLLDTHILLWAVANSPQLSTRARTLLTDSENELVFSVVSIWEIAIKHSMGKEGVGGDPGILRRTLLDHQYVELPITGRHAVATTTLPWVHKDPFDRLLVAQAQTEGITLLTADDEVARYPGPILKV